MVLRDSATVIEDTPPELTAAVRLERRRGAGTGPPGVHHRAALRPADGYRMGQGRRNRQTVHRAGAPGNREGAQRRQWRALCAEGRGEVRISGRAIGQKIGAGRVRVVASPAEMDKVQAGRCAGHRHDRPGLGAGDEAGGRHRHQPRRAHLPRRHRRARTGHPRRGRRRPCHHGAEGRRDRDGVVRRRRHRPGLCRQAGVRGGDAGERDAARTAGQADDERRQSRACLRICADAQSRRRPRAAGIHHQRA